VIAVLMLVTLVVAGVLVARAERKRQAQRAFADLMIDMTAAIAELGRVMGEQLLPAVRATAKAFDDFGRALLKNGATKWK
jgi:CHASE1-domain containing sensor protein